MDYLTFRFRKVRYRLFGETYNLLQQIEEMYPGEEEETFIRSYRGLLVGKNRGVLNQLVAGSVNDLSYY